MAEAPPQQQFVDIDPDFEPLSRPRSCTWPLPRPEFLDPSGSSTSSPAASVKHEPGGHADYVNSLSLLEESEDYREQKAVPLCGDFGCQEECIHHQQQQQQHQHHHQPQQHHHSPQVPQQQQQQQQQQAHAGALPSPVGSSSSVSAAAAAAAQRKSSSSRRNAWGNMSYADLITKAIESSPEKRLTLSQIYDWMVKSVPYFKDKGDSNSSAGWKNSIRHNLSLHSRFVRVQNEGTGKSSWWMLNPEGGKSGKSPRRRAASMDNNSKFTRSRGRAAKKKVSHQSSEGGADSPGSQFTKWPGSPNSHSNDDFEAWNTFRPRTSSNASTVSGRLSPFLHEQDDLGDGDMHLIYPPGPASKMSTTLPSLTEVTGSLDHHGSENVMESLLDNLNLVSPKGSQVGGTGGGTSSGSAQSSPSSMMQANTAYPAYSSPSMTPQPPQDYRKHLYEQAGVSTLPPMNLQTLPETKPSYGSYLGQYCPAGLLKELLTSDADPHGELMPSVDTVVTQSAGGCILPPYGTQTQQGPGVKMMSQHPHPHPHPHQHQHQHTVHSQAPPTTVALNGRVLHPLISMSHAPAQSRLAAIKQHMQLPHGQQLQPGGTGGLLPGYCGISANGYGRPGFPQPHPHEKLPSDLDGMSVERFECDMESVLHDALMDGDSLDFNFEPMVTQQGFVHGVKTTTHSWVSG